MSLSDQELRLRKTDWRTIDGETIVLDPVSERYLSLNRSATLMWERLVVGVTRADLVSLLVASFELEQARAGADVDDFLAALRRENLLVDPSR